MVGVGPAPGGGRAATWPSPVAAGLAETDATTKSTGDEDRRDGYNSHRGSDDETVGIGAAGGEDDWAVGRGREGAGPTFAVSTLGRSVSLSPPTCVAQTRVPPPTCAAENVWRPSSFSASAAARPTKYPVWVGWGAGVALPPSISACGAGAS